VLNPESLLPVLERQPIDRQWLVTAFDSQKTVVARSRGLAEALGRPVSPEFAAVVDRGGGEGWTITHTLEGEPVYTAYARSPLTAWGVGIGIPLEAVDAPLRRSLIAIAAGGLGCAGLALAVAVLVGRRVTAPMAALAAAARRFGEGGALGADAPAGVDEVEDVRRAFVGAAALVRQRAEEAAVAARAKDEFLAILSHELRTPLNAVYGWARMLQDMAFNTPQQAHALDVIVRQSNAQLQLIDNLLDVSRVVTGKMRLDVRPTDLPAVIEQAIDAVRPAADAKGMTVDPPAALIMADAARLQRVIWNLVMNGVKFTLRGGRVDVRVDATGAHATIVVSDTGAGIPADVLPFVFEPFRQADSSSTRAHGGLGLGLALVRQIVELHGGTVTARSDGPGRGATFTVTLPRAAAPAPSGPLAASAAPRGGARLHGLRVLVVDDDPDATELTGTILTAAGATVLLAHSGAEALDALSTWRPDVLVSDVGMPVTDGYALIREVRARDATDGGRTPAVALTAYGRAQDRAAALTAGFDMHVPKPVDPGELTTIVASVARHRGD
jgi:signal transduction histidine kinase/ActR/RegA family two-component response regulator